MTDVKKWKEKQPPYKLLALDGGGIRGIVAIEILSELEKMLRNKTGKPALVLADYFDYVAGTSTGAIIAACISLGMSASQIRDFYLENGRSMFDKASLLKRFYYKYEEEKLTAKLKEVFKSDTLLGSERLKTLLMVVLRNATTDSPWPVSSNPTAKYNVRADRPHDCNLDLPLWQIVRASTAAPTYFPPEIVQIGTKEFIFVDGGVTVYNNPAFLLFLMATIQPYNLQWIASEKQMLLVSVGTGASASANANLHPGEMNLIYSAASLPSGFMFAAMNEQDMLCRVFGKCLQGRALDREIGDLIANGRGPVNPKLFTYLRYNADLSREGLSELGLPNVLPKDVQEMDSIEHISELRNIGQVVAAKDLKAEHFSDFLG